MKYTKPATSRQRLSGLMTKPSGVCCVDIQCTVCA